MRTLLFASIIVFGLTGCASGDRRGACSDCCKACACKECCAAGGCCKACTDACKRGDGKCCGKPGCCAAGACTGCGSDCCQEPKEPGKGAALRARVPNLALAPVAEDNAFVEAFAYRSEWPAVAMGYRFDDVALLVDDSFDDQSFYDRLGGSHYRSVVSSRSALFVRP